jgi:hypothetical protein
MNVCAWHGMYGMSAWLPHTGGRIRAGASARGDVNWKTQKLASKIEQGSMYCYLCAGSYISICWWYVGLAL